MTLREAQRRLQQSDLDKGSLFEILQAIADGLEGDASSTQAHARDVLIRCLEHRAAFGNLSAVLNSLLHRAGLFQYENLDQLGIRDRLDVEARRYFDGIDHVTLHFEQERILERLLSGENIILSAPTSFGKSKLIDILIASDKFKNVVLIVPTIALIDETRRRLAKFQEDYKIISHAKQRQRAKNIFVMTAERFLNTSLPKKVDFFAIDEFYKLGFASEEDQRVAALNQAFYKLLKTGAQFYLLGPLVQRIPVEALARFSCQFHYTTYATVAVNQHRVGGTGTPVERLKKLVRTLSSQTLLYCQSPNRATETLIEVAGTQEVSTRNDDVANWIGDAFHPDWSVVKGLQRGVGLHHGRLPRSLTQWAVRLFNSEQIKILVCTSSLIEGVNTAAKNVIIYDGKIARRSLDYFTFNNIRGRSGRMFRHFVGDVYLFVDPPQAELPFVDIPVVTQGATAPLSVLLQMDEKDLTSESRSRVDSIVSDSTVGPATLRAVPEMEPEDLIKMIKRLRSLSLAQASFLNWASRPTWDQLKGTCRLLWDVWGGPSRVHGVSSGAQLAFKIRALQNGHSYRAQIESELTAPQYAASSVDDAVNRVFEFERYWATHQLPRWLCALDPLVKRILQFDCSYVGYAGQVEALFRPQYLTVLEEFGVPIQLSQKLARRFRNLSEVDTILATAKQLRTLSELTPFERHLFRECISGI